MMITIRLKLPLFLFSVFPMASMSCRGEESKSDTDTIPTPPMKILLKIGPKAFQATLENNRTADAFWAMLPLTVKMSDLNRNEKLHRFPNKLPAKDRNPVTIQSGDLMIWSSDTLVLFYEDFRTSYSYTRLGKLNDPTGLSDAVGSGDVVVTFEKTQ